MQDKLVSRDRECDELQRCLESDRSEFVIISGRRRIGKTYLIDKFFNYKYDFTFVGEHNTPASVQIQNFMRAIKRHSKRRQPKAETWYDAFNALEDYLETLSKFQGIFPPSRVDKVISGMLTQHESYSASERFQSSFARID